jgi:hypothetical protein
MLTRVGEPAVAYISLKAVIESWRFTKREVATKLGKLSADKKTLRTQILGFREKIALWKNATQN